LEGNHGKPGDEDGGRSLDEPPDTNSHTCETLDDGTEAFMQWMNSADKKSLSSGNPIVLVKFINDKQTILYDTTLSAEIDVELTKGIPYCNHCKTDDCAHVGFTILVEQIEGHRHDGKEETVDDMIDS